MSTKEEIEVWVRALEYFDKGEFEEALIEFDRIAYMSKIFFNAGMIHAVKGEHLDAIERFDEALHRDCYLAVAYFQRGISRFLMEEYLDATVDFSLALEALRENNHIDYPQLGLDFKLHRCEILFNLGLSFIKSQNTPQGIEFLILAQACKVKEIPAHNVIGEVIKESDAGRLAYTVFSVPSTVIFRPPESKVRNLTAREFMGRPIVVAAAPGTDKSSLNFVGAPNYPRGRNQSSPPANRAQFPPTPPPDSSIISAPTALSTPQTKSPKPRNRPSNLNLSMDSIKFSASSTVTVQDPPPPVPTSQIRRAGSERSSSVKPLKQAQNAPFSLIIPPRNAPNPASSVSSTASRRTSSARLPRTNSVSWQQRSQQSQVRVRQSPDTEAEEENFSFSGDESNYSFSNYNKRRETTRRAPNETPVFICCVDEEPQVGQRGLKLRRTMLPQNPNMDHLLDAFESRFNIDAQNYEVHESVTYGDNSMWVIIESDSDLSLSIREKGAQQPPVYVAWPWK